MKLEHQESIDHEKICLFDCDCCVGALWPLFAFIFLLCARCELAECFTISHCLEHDGHIAIFWAFKLEGDSAFDDHIHVIFKVTLSEDSRSCWQDHVVGFSAEELPLSLVEVVEVFVDAQHLLQRLDLAIAARFELEFSADEQRLLVREPLCGFSSLVSFHTEFGFSLLLTIVVVILQDVEDLVWKLTFRLERPLELQNEPLSKSGGNLLLHGLIVSFDGKILQRVLPDQVVILIQLMNELVCDRVVPLADVLH